jgi:hypothetical protein
MTTVIEAPPPGSPPQQSEWCRTTLEHFATFKNAEKVLSEPIPTLLSIDDCLEIRQRIGWRPSLSDQLRFSQLPVIVQETLGGILGDIVAYAGRCSGEGKRLRCGEALTDVLRACDDAIIGHLDAGEPAEMVLSQDFGTGKLGDGLVLLIEKAIGNGDKPYYAGVVKRLPPDHAARALCEELYVSDEGPVVILGPQHGPNTPARPFYFFDRIKAWTDLFTKAQAKRMAAQPLHRLSMEQIAKAKADLELQNRHPPKVPVPPPVFSKSRGWTEDVIHTLETLPKSEKLFKAPPANTPLADLLAVRAVLIRSDGPEGEDENFFSSEGRPQTTHLSANRWAARSVGVARKQRLQELITTLVVGLDRRLDIYVSEGSLWAARRADKIDSELAELRAEIAALKRRKP